MKKYEFLTMLLDCLHDGSIEIGVEVIPSPYRDDPNIQVQLHIGITINNQMEWFDTYITEF